MHSYPIIDKMAVSCSCVILQAAAAATIEQFRAHTSICCRIPQYSSALTVAKTVAKRPRSDGQDASRPGPAVTPQAKDSATAVEQLASLQCRLSLKGVAMKPVTDLAGKTQAVFRRTVKWFLEANKLPYKEGHLEDASGGLVEVEGGGVALQSCTSAAFCT